jgi:AcrR family transcriptional regulator
MARRTKEDAEKTREALLDAAERVFLRHGFVAATLNEIAKEAGVTRGALYWHFADKLAIFIAMNERVKSPMDALFAELTGGPDPVAGLEAMSVSVLRDFARDEHTRNVIAISRLRVEEGTPDDAALIKEVREKHAQVHAKFERVFAQAKLAPGMTAPLAAQALHMYFSGIIAEQLLTPNFAQLTKDAPLLMRCFFDGLLA